MTDLNVDKALSPAAQVVLDAIARSTVRPKTVAPVVAAAIKAAADVIDFDPWLKEHADYCAELCAIAAELESLSNV
jgi:hypothetical protein